METLIVKFVRDKETPNQIRFKEVRDGGWRPGEKPVVGNLYLRKPLAATVTAVRVTVEDISSERDGSPRRTA
jgi:hypothetical protein